MLQIHIIRRAFSISKMIYYVAQWCHAMADFCPCLEGAEGEDAVCVVKEGDAVCVVKEGDAVCG